MPNRSFEITTDNGKMDFQSPGVNCPHDQPTTALISKLPCRGQTEYNLRKRPSYVFPQRPCIQTTRVESFPTRGIRNRGIARYGHDAFGNSSSGDRGNPSGTVFNLRPSRRDEGHVLSKYSGRPNRSFRTHFFVFWRVDISLKPSASSDTRRDATTSLANLTRVGRLAS